MHTIHGLQYLYERNTRATSILATIPVLQYLYYYNICTHRLQNTHTRTHTLIATIRAVHVLQEELYSVHVHTIHVLPYLYK